MPSKQTTKQGDPRLLTRTALLREYGLSDQTLRRLIDSLGLVTLPAVTEHGKVLYSVSDAADAMLRLGRLCPFSFDGLRLPMYRYLVLGCLTSSSQDVVDSLHGRGIDNRGITVDYVDGMKQALQDALPAPIAKMIAATRPPETDTEDSYYAALLAVVGITSIYQAPDVLEQFYFSDPALLHFIHQVIWTHSSSAEVKSALINTATGQQSMTSKGMLLYAHIFHDSEFMRESDIAKYVSGLAPKYRAAYSRSLTMTTEQWMVESQLAQDTAEELVHLSRQFKARIRALATSASQEDRLESARLLTSVLKLDDHIGKVKPAAANAPLPDHLKEITPEPYRFDEMFRVIPELTAKDGATNAG